MLNDCSGANHNVPPQDKKLTKKEILDHHDMFVGSQATDFGEYLVKHDEF